MRIATLLLAATLPVVALSATLPKNEPVPGGVVVMQLPAAKLAPVVHFDARRIMVIRHAGHWYAITGIPLETRPGGKTLSVRQSGAPRLQLKFSVLPKTYAQQDLSIKNPKLVNPTEKELARIEQEQAHLQQVLNSWRPDANPALDFIWPARGPETSGFGLRRFLNGEARSPHSGIDIGAPMGSAVEAPAAGLVADVGDYYFCGHTLTISLGQGLYSVYCHLSKILVSRGQHVRQGQVVGEIGASGRTTGPNLHWTVSLNGTPVDPHAFLIQGPPSQPADAK
ncbi:MAG: peptidoglycan DD-metalloendopeptidase family protein [Gammaproteobacteria bacterium]|nr:peptidoglycan DD-metalloendopeptidase family protein [Gammaproteobacteria bacterium]